MTVLRYAGLGGLLWFSNKKWRDLPQRKLLLLLLAVGIVFPDLSQVITGANLEVDHWIGRFLYPFSTFMLVLWIGELGIDWFTKLKKPFLVLLVMIVLGRVSRTTYFELNKPIINYKENESRQMLFKWMMKNLSENDVVGSLSFSDQVHMVTETPYYSFIPRGDRSLSESDRAIRRYVYLTKMMGVGKETLLNSFVIPGTKKQNSQTFDVFSNLFGVRYHYSQAPYLEHQTVRSQATELFDIKFQRPGRLDYLLLGPTEEGIINIDNLIGKCETVFKNEDYLLFSVRNCFLRV